jgi:hypothetical protein
MNFALTGLDQWFTANQLVLNIAKTNVITFTPKTKVLFPLGIFLTHKVLDEVPLCRVGCFLEYQQQGNVEVQN